MSKISSRNIQVFVAGVLAYLGFDALVQMPFAFFHSQDVLGFSDIVSGFIAIALAGGIVVGSMRALRWLQIILWLGLIVDFITIFMLVSGISRNVWHVSLYRVISSFLTLLALLCLIAWSRSKRFRADGTPNTTLEPTPTAP
jgi:hypothetical protein